MNSRKQATKILNRANKRADKIIEDCARLKETIKDDVLGNDELNNRLFEAVAQLATSANLVKKRIDKLLADY